MKEGRAAFRDLLGRIDAHLRLNGGESRLPELREFWQAAESPHHAVALASFEKLLGLAQNQGFDAELLPFVEASRVLARKIGRPSLPRRSSTIRAPRH
jgi:hypothetical protein